MSKTPVYPGLRSFLSYLRQYKWRFTVVTLAFIVANVLLALMPLFIGKLVGALAANPIRGHQAVLLTWVLIALSTLHDATWQVSETLFRKLLKPLGYQYENLLFRQTIRKPYPYFVGKFTGKISSYITTIDQELRDFMENLCYNYTSSVVGLISLGIILASVNWQTGVIFAAGLVLMFFVGRQTISKSAKYERLASDVMSTKNGKLIDAIANFVNIKSFHKESVETKVIELEQIKTIKSADRSFVWSQLFWWSMGLCVRNLIWPASISLNVYLFLHHKLSVSQLATLLSAILLFSTTIWETIWYVSQFNLRLARIEEAHRYLFGTTNVVLEYKQDIDEPLHELSFQEELRLAKLSFAYPDKPETKVLSAINLTIRKGEKLGVVGRSGSGKTTITKLLLGYYPADKRTILLDGQAVTTRDLSRLISYVPQDTSLFHRSIADNIAYAADKPVSLDEVITAAKRAHAHEFIAQISEGYEALVGERGVKLSAGQRQRIAIARAFLDDKPILILDEATSALDSESEVLVQKALEALWQDKTVIAIAHRLSTLRHMDRIIVLDKGKIIEEGTHQELLAQSGQYAEFWAHQSGGFIEE